MDILGQATAKIQEGISTQSTASNSEAQDLLKGLGLNTSTVPSSTTTLFPPLSLPGSSLDTDIINQKLTKIQSSINDGFAQVISKLSALSLSKQGGGTRKKNKKSRRVVKKIVLN